MGRIVSSHAFVSPEGQAGPWQLGIHGDTFIPGLTQMARAAHDSGSAIALQLAHAGLQAATPLTNMEAVGPSSLPRDDDRQGKKFGLLFTPGWTDESDVYDPPAVRHLGSLANADAVGVPEAINNWGDVVGTSDDVDSLSCAFYYNAESETMINIASLGDGGQTWVGDRLDWPNESRATHSAIASPRTFWPTATTFAWCRNYWATRTLGRRWSTRMS